MNVANRIAIYLFTILFFLAAIVAVYFQQWIVFFVPFLLLLCTYLIQNPTLLFYLLLAAIPWSIEFNFNANLGTDLPDEPLMLLSSMAVLLLLLYNQKKFTFSKIHPLIFILLVQLAWTIFTIIHSTYILISIKYFLAKSWYLLAFVAAPVLLIKDEKALKRSAMVLL